MSQDTAVHVRRPGAIVNTLTELSRNGASSGFERLSKRSRPSFWSRMPVGVMRRGELLRLCNGNLPEGEIITGLGLIKVRVPNGR